ncbi:YopX family protein [Bacillus subtilis]|nr:YopX family protein [Bacillus subtilis]
MNTAYRVWDGERMHYWDDEGLSLIITGEEWSLYRNVSGSLCPNRIADSTQNSAAFMLATGFACKEKETFREDIVKYGIKQHIGVICYDRNQAKYKVVPLEMYHANAGGGGWTGFTLNRSTPIEVIGNVYKNPELLEV